MPTLPITYKSFYIKAPFHCVTKEETITEIPSGHYLVKLATCGFCHSDLLWIKHRAKNWEKIGHEFGGKIIAKGSNANIFNKGQQVAVKNATQCKECIQCKKGDFRQCPNIITNKSGFDQFFIADEKSLVSAEGISSSSLGLVEPLSVANEIVETANIQSGDSVGIIGIGTIGLLAGFLCTQKGALTYGFSRRSIWFDLASHLGFRDCFNQTRGHDSSCNKILVFAPPSCLNEITDLLQHSGTITVAGLNENDWDATTPFNFEKIIFKHGQIKGAFAYPNLYFENAIAQLRENKFLAQKLITHQFPLDQLASIVKKENSLPSAYLKIIFKA